MVLGHQQAQCQKFICFLPGSYCYSWFCASSINQVTSIKMSDMICQNFTALLSINSVIRPCFLSCLMPFVNSSPENVEPQIPYLILCNIFTLKLSKQETCHTHGHFYQGINIYEKHDVQMGVFIESLFCRMNFIVGNTYIIFKSSLLLKCAYSLIDVSVRVLSHCNMV